MRDDSSFVVLKRQKKKSVNGRNGMQASATWFSLSTLFSLGADWEVAHVAEGVVDLRLSAPP